MKALSDQPITIGCQNSWSSHPLMTELTKYAPRLLVQKDDCAGLYKKLDQGELQYAFCSSISLAKNPDFEMAMPVGISVDGASGLAIWGLGKAQTDLKQLIDQRVLQLREIFKRAQLTKTSDMKNALSGLVEAIQQAPVPKFSKVPLLRVTTGYSSWGALSRITYRLLFGHENYEIMLRTPIDSGEACIDFRVENEALQKRCSYGHVIDLSDLWFRVTHMPFVSSVLQKKVKNCTCRSQMSEASELAEMRMQVEPCNYLPDMLPRNCLQQQIDLCSVWKNLSYRLSLEDLRSLQVFLTLAKPTEKKGLEDQTLMLKLLRLQERESALLAHMA